MNHISSSFSPRSIPPRHMCSSLSCSVCNVMLLPLSLLLLRVACGMLSGRTEVGDCVLVESECVYGVFDHSCVLLVSTENGQASALSRYKFLFLFVVSCSGSKCYAENGFGFLLRFVLLFSQLAVGHAIDSCATLIGSVRCIFWLYLHTNYAAN